MSKAQLQTGSETTKNVATSTTDGNQTNAKHASISSGSKRPKGSKKPATQPKKGEAPNVDKPAVPSVQASTGTNKNPGRAVQGKSTKGTKKTHEKKNSASDAQKAEQRPTGTHVPPKVKQLYSSLELVGIGESRSIAEKDGVLVSSDPKGYANANAKVYYIAINSWLLQIRDVLQDTRTAAMLLDQLRVRGLLPVIQEAQAAADLVIIGYSGGSNPTLERTPIEQIFVRVAHKVDDQQVLQLLRYLKRFSPQCTDLLVGKALSDFFAINDRCGKWQKDISTDWSGLSDQGHKPIYRHASSISSTCHYLETRLEYFLSIMFKDFEKQYKLAAPSFSSGTSQNGRLLQDKIDSYANRQPFWLSPEYVLLSKSGDSIDYDTVCRKRHWRIVRTRPLMSAKGDGRVIRKERFERTCFTDTGYLVERYFVTPTAVPKSYKTARIIASESAYHGAELQRVREAMVRSLAKSKYSSYFDPTDQDKNRMACQLGSIIGTYSSIDLSGASDSISKSLGNRVMPISITRRIRRHMARYLKTPEKQLILSKMFATSGCPITFVSLGAICLAICLTAEDIYISLTGDKSLNPSYVFGDDCMVDTKIFQLVCDIFNRLGFVINSGKSYSSGSTYRESCGSEYSEGYDLTTQYFPRAQLSFKEKELMDTVTSIIDLQHKLFDVSWDTQRFLGEVCDQLVAPKILTRSLPGSSTTDIWSEVEKKIYRKEPYDRKRGGIGCTLVSAILAWNNQASYEDRIIYQYTDDGLHLEILVPYSSGFVTTLVTKTQKSVSEGKTETKPAKPVVPNSNLEMYYYSEWLKRGPQYDEPLLELLGIPSKRRKELDCNMTVTSLTYVQD